MICWAKECEFLKAGSYHVTPLFHCFSVPEIIKPISYPKDDATDRKHIYSFIQVYHKIVRRVWFGVTGFFNRVPCIYSCIWRTQQAFSLYQRRRSSSFLFSSCSGLNTVIPCEVWFTASLSRCNLWRLLHSPPCVLWGARFFVAIDKMYSALGYHMTMWSCS